MELLTGEQLAKRLEKLGPEPLEDGFDLAGLKRTKRPIKVALLDQQLVAGLGNIYASESLWRALRSIRAAWRNRLKPEEVRQPAQARDHRCLAQVRLASGPEIFDVQGFAVYDRAGKACRQKW